MKTSKIMLVGGILCILASTTQAHVHIEAATSSEVRVADINHLAGPLARCHSLYLQIHPTSYEIGPLKVLQRDEKLQKRHRKNR